MDTYKYTTYIRYYEYELNLVTSYSDFITGNNSVHVKNLNKCEYTKNTHCENTSNIYELECENIMLGDIYLTRIFRQ